MSSVAVQSRVSPELKAQAEAIFTALGLSTSDAIRMFLQQAVNTGGLPFQPTIGRPNAVRHWKRRAGRDGGPMRGA